MTTGLNWKKIFQTITGAEDNLQEFIRDAYRQPVLPYHVPVLVVSYFPTKDGRIDRDVTGDVDGLYEQVKHHTLETTWKVAQALENGSAYHLYKNPLAVQSLRYHIVETIEIQEPLPTWNKPGKNVPMTDYNAIMDRIDARRWVEEEGIKEIWVWGYHGGVIDIWESNMAGPFGDISNSDRDPNDLPVFNNTYTVYHYNYQRGPSEAVENHMHQIEAVFREIDRPLFWDKFVGKPGEGRCGWSHFPPNGERDYDWMNDKDVLTDIEDWKPDGSGEKKRMNCDRWYRDSLCWFIYWMQNIPGHGHELRQDGKKLTNWWAYIGDFDNAMKAQLGLVEK